MIIREYSSDDCAEIISLFRDTVHHINAKDYTPEQLYTWAPDKIEVAKWNLSLMTSYTLVALEEKIIVGFGNVDEAVNLLDHLFVHKDYQRHRIGTALCDCLEDRLAGGNITTYASITSRPFFEKRGYTVVKELEIGQSDVKLKSYCMIKK